MYELIRDGRCICRGSDRCYLEKILRKQRSAWPHSAIHIRIIS